MTRLRQPPSFGQAPVAAFGHGMWIHVTWLYAVFIDNKCADECLWVLFYLGRKDEMLKGYCIKIEDVVVADN